MSFYERVSIGRHFVEEALFVVESQEADEHQHWDYLQTPDPHVK